MKWYEILNVGNTTLEQGDFIPNCPLPLHPEITENDEEVEYEEVEYDELNMIILSQTCDLANGKLPFVIVAQISTIKEFSKDYEKTRKEQERNPKYVLTSKEKEKLAKQLKQGGLPNYHLLNEDKGLNIPFYVVNFRDIYSVSLAVVQSIAQKNSRWRLCSPYKEHFAQAFARFFMRVGLPNDYDEKEIEKAL